MQQVHDSLDRLTVAEPAVHRNLALYALIDAAPAEPVYATLDEALAAGTLRITETGKGGSVPELSLTNDGARPVLLLDGEELVGAKQNRVLNITVLVAAKTSMIIPVSCVEQGRWGWRGGRHFESAGRSMYAGGRRAKMSQVSDSLRHRGLRQACQSQVWDDITECAVGFDVSSPTGAMADIFESQADDIDACVNAFPSLPGQTGAVFAIGGRVSGCEVFDSAATWASLAPKLIGSYALDALAMPARGNGDPQMPTVTAASAFLRQVGQADASSHEALGLGHDIRLDSAEVVGGALEYEDRIVHLSVFAQRRGAGPEGGKAPRSRLWSFGARRGNRRR